jgi:hypothetical protein
MSADDWKTLNFDRSGALIICVYLRLSAAGVFRDYDFRNALNSVYTWSGTCSAG